MGTVDYRLARRASLRGWQRGLATEWDLCDAHPELVRAARHIGRATQSPCPVCDNAELRLVFYTFGPALRRENGRVRRPEDLPGLHDRFPEFECYVIEVCTDCSWNHLVRSFTGGFRHRAGRAGRAAAR